MPAIFVAILMFREWIVGTPAVYLFAVFSTLVWVMWLIKVILSYRYRAVTAPYLVGTSVLIPVVDEPTDLFHDVLSRIVEQGPDEVIVVINGPRNVALEAVCDAFDLVQCYWTAVPGKRNAIHVANTYRTREIAVLVDSDTIWTNDNDGTLAELVKPFADPAVGGVTTRQRILSPNRSFITRWADWLENTRGLYSMPAQSVLGQVGCLPGRTIAFRGHVLDAVMNDFLTQRFLGTFLEVSDDRTLTNLTLRAGYRTVYQYTSLCYTDAPLKLRKLYRQQLRWARGSTYNTTRMLPWYASHAPLLGFFFLMDIALPFLLAGAVIGWGIRGASGNGVNFYKPILDAYPGWQGIAFVVGLAVISSWTSMVIRQVRHWSQKPSDLLRLPLFIIFSTVFLMPIRIIGFFKMAHNAAWGTRKHAFAGNAETDIAGYGTADLETMMVGAEQRKHPKHGPGFLADASNPHQPQLTGPTAAPRKDRRLNPYAAIPYVVGAAILTLEVYVSVQ